MARKVLTDEGVFTRKSKNACNDNFTELYAGTTGGTFASPTITGTVAGGATYTAPVMTTPTLGVATATSVNKVAITAPASSATLTIANAKTLTVSNSLTLAGTDSTTMTFPGASANILSGIGLYKVARGVTALDGSNPTPAATGLTTIVAAVATIQRTSAVSSGTAFVTVDFTGSDGTLNLYGWVLAGSASSGTENINWIAIGT